MQYLAAHNSPTDLGKSRPNSYQDHLRIQNIQVFSRALDAPIISLNNAPFCGWLLDYKTDIDSQIYFYVT